MPERKFYIANFGCRASQSEGASIEQELLAAATTSATSPYEADVVVVNSCTVTSEADREVRQLIRRIRMRSPGTRVIVTGCYAQRAPDEVAALPGVAYVVGNSHKSLVSRFALDALENDGGPPGRAEVYCSSIFLQDELKPENCLGSSGRTRAILKVQDGCNANCSFCIIPSVRGRSRSLDADVVVEQVQSLVERGYKEVVFSGIHLGTYGRDLTPRLSLVELLRRVLSEVRDLERLRLSSIEPLEVTPDIVELVCESPRIAHHFHVPLQSGSRRVLREMRRPYTPDYYGELLRQLRSRVPDAAIGADVMVGFPGESDGDFAETYHLIYHSPLTYLHVFPYSARPGTPAADLPGAVPPHVAQVRARALRRLIAEKNRAFRDAMVGRSLEVLVLERADALSDNFIRVQVPPELPSNTWVPIQITGVTESGLEGKAAGLIA